MSPKCTQETPIEWINMRTSYSFINVLLDYMIMYGSWLGLCDPRVVTDTY